mmetsp:Transcript_7758/g.9851  ORF Transcript_7758/g.9851 Transcript_7758/m.9851 type:complete len:778 (-) Transcript_7758:122-2455(-)
MTCLVWGRGIELGLEPPVGIEAKKFCIGQPKAMEGLGEERIVDCACGESHTLLVTQDGDVVSFGRNREGQLGRSSDSAPCGRVEGLEDEVCKSVAAGAFHSIVVTMSGRLYEFGLVAAESSSHGEKEQERTTTAGAAPARELRGNNRQDIVLRRIVRESTERWLLASDIIHDDEPQNEEDAELLSRTQALTQEEARAAVGIARMDARRTKLCRPRLATSLNHVRIETVAAGYGHTLARTIDGQLYASGYNDRGQLGLGHRCNIDIFQHVETFAHSFVKQIAAGSQHSLAIVQVKNKSAILFAWGQGSLGQLGLGRRVTGRLRPVPVTISDNGNNKIPITCAAGANHSIVIDAHGKPYGFGHAEYFQLGGIGTGGNDFIHSDYYTVPRPVLPAPDRPLVAVCCGANFSIAIADNGSIISWGWPQHGVLGRGTSFAASTPTPHSVEGLDGSRGTPPVVKISGGTRHAVCLARDARDPYALRFRKLLTDASLGFDLEIKVDGDENSSVKAHAAVLAARSRYLRGLIKHHIKSTTKEPLLLPAKIGGVAVSTAMIRALVNYLYTDRVDAPPHRLRALSKLGRYLCMDLFADLCDPDVQPGSLDSTFAVDMAQLVADPFAADLRLRLYGGRELCAHKAIIATNSEYFDALIHFETHRNQHDEKTEQKDEHHHTLELLDWGAPESLITLPVALAVLKFLYSGAILVDNDVSPFDLIMAADLLRIQPLVLACERFLVEFLANNPDHAQNCFDFTDRFDFCSRLRRAAIDVLSTTKEESTMEYKN